ncbi:hypothetical protein ACNFJ7_07960 [Sphingomonas sp. HT-1]|uniref:hypothetical protein n=1 Tax=unclassified Sphingomonas TaxID=196159 RepID=UPI00030DAA45|nr:MULTISPECIES: hypothetical protein [unclassified Sphingomonas]KTF70716.1 hypothetical protein ATB93_03040 [Sphingomonas sp. WG]
MLTATKRAVRLTPSQARTLTSIAERRGLTDYAMLQRIIEAGFLAVMHGTDRDTDTREIATGVGVISERLAEVERVLDRALFTACAAYAYARHSALGTKKPDEVIAADAKAAFERQRSLALEIEP